MLLVDMRKREKAKNQERKAQENQELKLRPDTREEDGNEYS